MIMDMNQCCASCLLFLWLLSSLTSAIFHANKRYPAIDSKMFSKDAFPEPDFDDTAPFCIPNREPCGFYSFTINGRQPFKWVKSWCRCAEDQECSFDRIDMRMRVFRHSCVPSNRTFYKRKHHHVHRQHRMNHPLVV